MSRMRYLSGVVLVALAACAACAPAASAAKRLDSYFGNPTAATGVTGGLFNNKGGVAVRDSTGAVYVADRGNHRIQQFDAASNFVRAFGQDVSGRNEQQRVVVNATAGSYTLTFSGSTTASIAFNASAATVDNALDVLPPIAGDANVAVSGSLAAGYTVTFQGTLAGTNVAEMTADASGLTGGTASVTITTLTQGAGGSVVGFEACTDASACKAGITSAQTGGAMNQPGGVAVNQTTGNIYVTDQGNLRVQEFTATGEFVRAWGQDVITNTGTPPNSNGTGFEICDTQHPTTPNTVADCKAGVGGGTGGAFASTFAGHPSVVPAGAPNAGNVLVADPGNQRVQEFTATGVFVRAFGYDVVQPGGAGEAFGPLQNERQKITLPLAFSCCLVDGGSFTLTFDGATTSAIAYNASAADVEAKLEQLGSIAGDNVTVTGPNGGPWEVEFTGSKATTDVPAMTGDGANLTVFGGPAGIGVFPVETTTQGGTLGPAQEICINQSECKAGIAGNNLGQFAANEPKRVISDAMGALYTVESSANLRAQKFTGASLVPALFTAAAALRGGTQTELAYDAVANRVLLAAEKSAAPTGACASSNLSQVLISEFTTSGTLTESHGSCTTTALPGGLAVRPSSGRLYLSAASVFDGPLTSTGRDRVWVLDGDGATPALVAVNPATNVSSSTADLSATVNPNSVDNVLAPTEWRLQYSRNGVEWLSASSGSIAVANTTPVPVTGSIAGLSPNTTYRVRVVTQKPFGNLESASPELTFVTDAVAPEIRTTSTHAVAPTLATVSARINPHGTPTTYRFEWGQQGEFDRATPVPSGMVGSGPDFVLVTQQLIGLAPGTTYQYRAVAVSASEGSTVGPTKTFTTPSGQLAGPQGTRAYELVSPADKLGGTGVGSWYAGVGSHGTAGVAAYEGERFVSISYYGGTLADGGFAYGSDATLGERTPLGWVNRPAFNRQGGFGASELAKLPVIYSSDDDLSLTSWAPNNGSMRIFEQHTQAFDDEGVDPRAHTLRDWSSGRWEVLAPVLPEQQVGSDAGAFASSVAGDGSHVLAAGLMRGVEDLDQPTQNDPTHPDFNGPGDLVCPSESTCNGNVYIDDVSAGLSDTFPGAGARSLLNECTGTGSSRTVVPSVTAGKVMAVACEPTAIDRPGRLISARGASVPSLGWLPGQLSDNGSRAFFMSPDHRQAANLIPCSGTGAGTSCPPQVYVRQRNTDGSVTTRWISQSTVPDQDASLLATAVFEGATPDGDKVFFRTASPLTADDPNGGAQLAGGVKTGSANANSIDLYMYDLPDGPDGDPATADGDPAGGVLTRISGGPSTSGDGNASTDTVVSSTGALRAFGDDGARVYFTTAAPLPGVPAPANGTITSPGGTAAQASTKNLYLYDGARPVAQRWRFIASLPANSALGGCASKGSLSRLDGLDGEDGLSGRVNEQPSGNCVHATADGSFISFFTDGRLMDDDPDTTSGDVYGYDAVDDELVRLSAPQGGIGGSYACADSTRCHGDLTVSGLGSKGTLSLVPDPEDRGDHTAFFESASRLVPDDHNDAYDVYQWHNGALSLISTGAAGAGDALYRGNDRTGTNVYISTRDALTWQDHDKVLDIYAARLGGGIAQPEPPSVCSVLSGTCQTPVTGGAVVDTRSTESGGDNAKSTPRLRLTLTGPSAQARRRAVRDGVLAVRLRSDAAGTAVVAATAKLGKKSRKVASSNVSFARAGAKTVKLRLSRAARRQLSSGGALRIGVTVTAAGARPRSLTVPLRKAGR